MLQKSYQTIAIIGGQWGDEGKGKLVDYFAQKADVIVRYAGGDNAGHSIKFGNQKFSLNLLPSGVFNPKTINIIGNGCVVNPAKLVAEINELKKQGINFKLFISENAHLIFPYHLQLDILEELTRGKNAIGTTKKGIGPCYQDKVARTGIRIADLMEESVFAEKLKFNIEIKNQLFQKIYDRKDELFSFAEIYKQYQNYATQLRSYVGNTSVLLHNAILNNKKVVFEGAQGIMLDIDHGTYPFVTSSNPLPGQIFAGAGIGPRFLNNVLGITKAYNTRVGGGPFPSEIADKIALQIRKQGNEFGTVTNRPRRIGWFDLVVFRHAVRVGGFTSLCLTLLDVLSGFSKIQVCVAYRYRKEHLTEFPASANVLKECQAEYITLPGWKEDITNIRDFNNLPKNAKEYVHYLENAIGIPIDIISVGPKRSQIIIRNNKLI